MKSLLLLVSLIIFSAPAKAGVSPTEEEGNLLWIKSETSTTALCFDECYHVCQTASDACKEHRTPNNCAKDYEFCEDDCSRECH